MVSCEINPLDEPQIFGDVEHQRFSSVTVLSGSDHTDARAARRRACELGAGHTTLREHAYNKHCCMHLCAYAYACDMHL
jgi:hypothetical protein